MKYALKHGHDSLGGEYEHPITISEHATLAEAIHALLADGNQHPTPRD